MATRALAIRDAIITELLKIGVTPASGWESGSGAPQVLPGRPRRDAIADTPERQLWVQHGRTEPKLEGFTAAGGLYRATFIVWLVCPDSVAGQDLASKLERDVRRALQYGESTLQVSTLANGGIYEDVFEARDDMAQAGVYVGTVAVLAEFLTAKGDP